MKKLLQRVPVLCLAGMAAVALSLASCANHMEVPLQWKPTTSAAEMQGSVGKVDLSGAKVQFAKLEDVAPNPTLIGKQPDDKEPKTVTTRDDVGAFVAKHLADSIAQLTPGSGLQITDTNPSVIVSGKVQEFFVTETRNYEGVVRLQLFVKKPDGTVLYDVNTVGKSSRLGIISFKAENYMEGFSDALLQVAKSLVGDPGFQAALRGEKAK